MDERFFNFFLKRLDAEGLTFRQWTQLLLKIRLQKPTGGKNQNETEPSKKGH